MPLAVFDCDTQLYLICVPRFIEPTDFDGFIRTLYSQPLHSRDLKSLIIRATCGGPSSLGERIMKRETVRGGGQAKEGGGRKTTINVRQSVRRAGD